MLNVPALFEAASAATGLSDFGDDSFVEGLDRLVTALNGEAHLSAAGEQFLQQRLALHLEQRLKLEQWYRRHPEIDEVEIVAPLIGVSLPRTGSTALSFLLAEDPDARSLRASESCAPADCRDAQTTESGDRRAQRPPGARVYVPRGDNPPAECQELMALEFRSQLFLAFAQVPSYADWLLDTDMVSTYQYEKRVLKWLQWCQPQTRWRLKAPTHLLYLDAINQVFPDARFVMTHREPSSVMLSVCTLYADYVSRLTDSMDPAYIGALNQRQWQAGIERMLAFRQAGHDARFYDVHFEDMRSDPIAAVRGLYDWLGEPVTPAFESNMRRWWAGSEAERAPPEYPDPSVFGLDLQALRSNFSEYTAMMGRWTGLRNGNQ